MKVILIVVAVVLALVAAFLGFGWFNSAAEVGDILGVISLSLAAFYGSHLVP